MVPLSELNLGNSKPWPTKGSGDLILVGSGDPTLSTNDLAELACAAVAAGLKTVAGQLLVDAAVFPANPVSDQWVWGDVGNAYGAGAFGLNLITIASRSVSSRAHNPAAPRPCASFRPCRVTLAGSIT